MPRSKIRSPWLKQLGDNIRRERLANGISQQQLAEIADLNIRNVQRIEAGELDILLTTVVRIKKALDCPLERLVPKFAVLANRGEISLSNSFAALPGGRWFGQMATIVRSGRGDFKERYSSVSPIFP